MSHIAEIYAKNLGVKIGKPIISQHFYPNLPPKYICFKASNNNIAKSYKYWDIVISLIKPHLGDIKVVQIKNQKSADIDKVDLSIFASNKQLNYIINKSECYLGDNDLLSYVANVFKKPIVSLIGDDYADRVKPLWETGNYLSLITPDFSKTKPSFGAKLERVDEINPENIAQEVLNALNIDKRIEFKTIRKGSQFHKQVVEVVPNFFSISKQLKDKALNVRGDIQFDLDNIIRWCEASYVNLYVKKPFDIEYLQYMKGLKQVSFIYEEDEEDEEQDLTDFFRTLKNKKIKTIIKVQDDSKLADVRVKYFDFEVVGSSDRPRESLTDSKYLSKKRFISNSEIYSSESSANRLDKSNAFQYDDISHQELENLYLYE